MFYSKVLRYINHNKHTKKMAQSAFRIWLTTFLLEKGIYTSEESQLLIDDAVGKDSHIGLTLEVFLQFLETEKKYQPQIKDTFVKIDFNNGDCKHYLKFLINAMFKQFEATSFIVGAYDEPYSNIK